MVWLRAACSTSCESCRRMDVGLGLLGTHLDLQSCLILGYSARMAPFPGLLQRADGLSSAAKVCLCEAPHASPASPLPRHTAPNSYRWMFVLWRQPCRGEGRCWGSGRSCSAMPRRG